MDLSKVVAELKKQEFKKAHPILGFLAEEPGCIGELDLSKAMLQVYPGLRKVESRSPDARETPDELGDEDALWQLVLHRFVPQEFRELLETRLFGKSNAKDQCTAILKAAKGNDAEWRRLLDRLDSAPARA